MIFRDEHINVGLPGIPSAENKYEQEESRHDNTQEEGGSPSAAVESMEARQDEFDHAETKISMQTFKATILIAQTSETLLNIQLTQNGGNEDIRHLQTIDDMLKKAWEVFPTELTDLSRSDILDLPAVRRKDYPSARSLTFDSLRPTADYNISTNSAIQPSALPYNPLPLLHRFLLA